MSKQKFIPFNQSYVGSKESRYVTEAIKLNNIAGDGSYTKKCQRNLIEKTGACKALLTHSATAALEMAALLLNLQPGDEVIMPSYTFVSTANAFVLRGAVPVFIDIRRDTLNIDETLIESVITPQTKAIVPVHYAGVACAMDEINAIATKYDLLVIEDAAQGLMASYKGIPLGGIGTMGVISFHATKNVSCGEGGAFLTKSSVLAERAEIIREKGTDRSKFFRGEIDKYSWIDVGSSFLPSELNAAYLLAQLEEAQSITEKRLNIWQRYQSAFLELEQNGLVTRPIVPNECQHNGHIYYLILSDVESRDKFITYMKERLIGTTFHYVPLHNSNYAKIHTRNGTSLVTTEDMASRIVRLPIWPGLDVHVDYIVEQTNNFFKES